MQLKLAERIDTLANAHNNTALMHSIESALEYWKLIESTVT